MPHSTDHCTEDAIQGARCLSRLHPKPHYRMRRPDAGFLPQMQCANALASRSFDTSTVNSHLLADSFQHRLAASQ